MSYHIDKETLDKEVAILKKQRKGDSLSLSCSVNTKDEFANRLRQFCQMYGGVVIGENKYNLLRKGLCKFPDSRSYRKMFGSWKEACLYSLGYCNKDFPVQENPKSKESEQCFDETMEETKVVRAMIEYKITTFRKLADARSKYPEIFPSIHWIKDRFGSFKNLLTIVKKASIDNEIKKVVDLRGSKSGRFPTYKEMGAKGINVEMLKKAFGSFRKVLEVSAELGKILEIKKRNQR